ncbi:DUF192 domain-containing protein [Aerosakkonemataceae cyanobacterium BLCC-F154]|uniref:DUF192 domain-containing protein n=1 Tax=Floridaenema fluviatile BLCC-F154 TaxID=3153640 RepID=A0ABV4YMC2_9CYAN
MSNGKTPQLLTSEVRSQKAESRRVEGFYIQLFTYFQPLNYFCRLVLGLVLGIWLLGCSTTAPANSGDIALTTPTERTKTSNNQELAQNSPQMLPISAKAQLANGEVIQLEVTRTPAEQAMGLMYRQSLPDDRGMLFSFSPPQPVSFWMKNVVIPLDMIFLQNGVVRAIATNVPPCKQDPCPTYGPNGTIDQVIELRGGRAAELGIKVGQQVKIEFFSPQPSNHTKSLP